MTPPPNGTSNKWKCPPPETLVVDLLYALSINPQEQPSITTTCTRRGTFKCKTHSTFFHKINAELAKLHNIKYDLIWECSSMGRWHLHGYVTFDNIQGFFLSDIFRLKDLGTFEIDTITDPVKWDTYVRKGTPLWKEYFEAHDWPYNPTTDAPADAVEAVQDIELDI